MQSYILLYRDKHYKQVLNTLNYFKCFFMNQFFNHHGSTNFIHCIFSEISLSLCISLALAAAA